MNEQMNGWVNECMDEMGTIKCKHKNIGQGVNIFECKTRLNLKLKELKN